MLSYAAQARYSKPRQANMYATVGHNNIKNKKGHHPNTPLLWETSRAQHCKAKRYSWAMENMTAQELLAAYAAGERNFSGALLSGANLSGADLSGADFSGADLYGANLIGANLSGANLMLANLMLANLMLANLSFAEVSGALFCYANLVGVDRQGVFFDNGSLQGAIRS